MTLLVKIDFYKKKKTVFMAEGILITGLNGCGKSTVCRLLSEKLNYYSMDVEDYYFIKSYIPYSKFNTLEETQQLMENEIEKHQKFVLTTVNCNWGEKINSHLSWLLF